MIRTWLADIRALYDEECYQKYFAALPAFRQEKQEAVVSERQGSECRGMAFNWRRSESGTKFPDRAVYNLSHSGDYVLCSIDTDAREGVQLGM